MSEFVECVSDADVWSRNGRVMENVSDLTLMILKGHLLTEELLRRILRKHAMNPTALKDARLSFFQVLRIVQALVGHPSFKKLWEEAEHLNRLRNLLAHNTEPNIEEKIDVFLARFPRAHAKRDKKHADRDRLLRLHSSLLQFLGALDFVLQRSPTNPALRG